MIDLAKHTLWSFGRIQIRLQQTVTDKRIYLTRKMEEFFLITYVFQYQYISGVQRDIPRVAHLMKEILGNQNDTDILVMAAICK